MFALIDHIYNTIPWVYLIDSGAQWPTICISACTHGGETAGLDVINFLIEKLQLDQKIQKGKIFFVLANIDAYKKYLATHDFWTSRFIDENMNRVCTVENIENGQSYEIQRVRELIPILASCDVHIDIHSTSQSASSIAIYTDKSKDIFASCVNVDEHYINLTNVQVGQPFISICECAGGIGVWLETGRQDDQTAFVNGIDNVCRILISLWIINTEDCHNILLDKKNNEHIFIDDSIVVHDNSFVLKDHFTHKQAVATWTIIAHENNENIATKQDYLIILPSHPERLHIGEEYCFLGKYA